MDTKLILFDNNIEIDRCIEVNMAKDLEIEVNVMNGKDIGNRSNDNEYQLNSNWLI